MYSKGGSAYGHVVDDEGNPLEVYHGTSKDFDRFELGHPERKDVGWLGHGLYFTNSREMAQANAQMKAKRVGGKPKVMSVNLSLQNPYYATLEDKARLQKANSSEASQAFSQALKDKGHDGVIWKQNDYHEYVAFDPDQVKVLPNQTSGKMPKMAGGGSIRMAEGGGADSDLETAKRLGMDTSSIPEIRKAGELRKVHKSFGDEVRETASRMQALGQEYHQSGKLPMPVGTRFHTSHSLANKLRPWTVKAHYVDGKDPKRYGYFAERGNEKDDDHQAVLLLASDPKADERFAQRGYPPINRDFLPLGNLTRVKAHGGSIRMAEGGPTIDQMRLALLNRKVSPAGFYSTAAEAARNLPQDVGTPQQMGAMLAKQRGVSDEMAHSDYGRLSGPTVTKQQLVSHFEDQMPDVQETVLRDYGLGDDEIDIHGIATKYGNYQLPGGENYREVLLTLPVKQTAFELPKEWSLQKMQNGVYTLIGPDGVGRSTGATTESDALWVAQIRLYGGQVGPKNTYKSPHWEQPNVLAHIRMNDRTDPNGNKVLFVEEIQSDWGQEGKKKGFFDKRRLDQLDAKLKKDGRLSPEEAVEYNRMTEMESLPKTTGGVPSAPFVTKTEGWLNLALKRIAKLAADEGYDKVAFVNGDQSADRYDLSKQVDQLLYKKNQDGTYLLSAITGGQGNLIGESIQPEKLQDYVGKEVAEKIASGDGNRIEVQGEYDPRSMTDTKDYMHSLSGDGLKVGGEGMKAFYDKIVPSAVNKLLPRIGGEKVKPIPVVHNAKATEAAQHQIGFDITPQMREQAKKGMPLFRKGGAARGYAIGGNVAIPTVDQMKFALLNRKAGGGEVDGSLLPLGRAQQRMASKMETGPKPLSISKDTGGQWMEGGFSGIEPTIAKYKQSGSNTPEKQAVNNWVDTTLTKYLKRDFGTENDPVRLLHEQGITHHDDPEKMEIEGRISANSMSRLKEIEGFPPKVAKTNLAKGWEDRSDSMIEHSKAGDLFKNHPHAVAVLSHNPWIKKVDPETKIFSINTFISDTTAFKHLTDELHNSLLPDSNLPSNLKLRPESLNRMSVAQAVSHVHKINEWRKDNIKKANLERANNAAVHLHKDYPDSNYAWYEIRHPELKPSEEAELRQGSLESIEDASPSLQAKYKMLEDALKYEGDTMGHCVGGYADDVASGNSRIYSLRNKKTGEPHVTIETTPSAMQGGQTAEQYLAAPHDIAQIKGKGNAKPVDRYIPFVQDFVKSQKWGDVYDRENAELIYVGNVLTRQEREELRKKGHEVGDYVSKDDLKKFRSAAKGGTIRMAIGGQVKGTIMPTLAQMKAALGLSPNIQNIGANEAPSMNPKTYFPPSQTNGSFVPPGGVALPSGMPIGGIDMSREPGQQFMPMNALQPQGGLAPQGGQEPQEGQGGSPVAPNAPQSNILQATPQGQMMSAIKPNVPQPPQGPQMADGGIVQYPTIDDGVYQNEDDQPGLFRATGMARGGQPKFEIQAATERPKDPESFSPYDDQKITMRSLAKAFDEAIAHHLSLSPEERAVNSQRAANAVAEHTGRTSNGKPKDLLGKNAKLLKTEKGEAKGRTEEIRLPDGRGVETTGLALAPAYEEGNFTTCPNSASCKAECLGKTSGNYFKLGGGQDLSEFKGPRLNSLRKTQAFLRDPHSFAVKLYDEIQAAKDMAAANNNHLGVRLNVLSDISPKVHKSIIENHPDVTFYDYTKNNSDPISSNHHYTYSSTGASQAGVNNSNTNWKQMRKRLDTGDNVAMAFSHKEHLPDFVHDQQTGKRYRVVDGDTHDFRPLDLQPEGEDGVIIGLRNKKATGSVNNAHKDSHGFFMHYDPQLKMKPNGTYERLPSTRKNEKGKPMLGATIPQNRVVNILPQEKDMKILTNDGESA